MRRIAPVIAERQLTTQDSDKRVRVTIGAPRRDKGGSGWACPFRIHGAGIARFEFGYGVDAMQALTTALDGIRALLDESGLSLGWDVGGGQTWDDETGFTRSIPIALGSAFRRRMERMLDREIRQHVQRLSRRARKKKAAKARR